MHLCMGAVAVLISVTHVHAYYTTTPVNTINGYDKVTCNRGYTSSPKTTELMANTLSTWGDYVFDVYDLRRWVVVSSVTCALCSLDVSLEDTTTTVPLTFTGSALLSPTSYVGSYYDYSFPTIGMLHDCMCPDNEVAVRAFLTSSGQEIDVYSYFDGTQFYSQFDSNNSNRWKKLRVTYYKHKEILLRTGGNIEPFSTSVTDPAQMPHILKNSVCMKCPKIDGIQTVSTRGAVAYSITETTGFTTACQCPAGYAGEWGPTCVRCAENQYSRLMQLPSGNAFCNTSLVLDEQTKLDFKDVAYYIDQPSFSYWDPTRLKPSDDQRLLDGWCVSPHASYRWLNSGCKNCPANRFVNMSVLATSISSCKCMAGHYELQGQCVHCPVTYPLWCEHCKHTSVEVICSHCQVDLSTSDIAFDNPIICRALLQVCPTALLSNSSRMYVRAETDTIAISRMTEMGTFSLDVTDGRHTMAINITEERFKLLVFHTMHSMHTGTKHVKSNPLAGAMLLVSLRVKDMHGLFVNALRRDLSTEPFILYQGPFQLVKFQAMNVEFVGWTRKVYEFNDVYEPMQQWGVELQTDETLEGFGFDYESLVDDSSNADEESAVAGIDDDSDGGGMDVSNGTAVISVVESDTETESDVDGMDFV